MTVCLAVSSQVVAGHVGLGALQPVLHGLGVEVWPMPTVLLSGHAATPGVQGRAVDAGDFAALIDGLERSGALARVDALMTGYIPNAAVLREVVRLVDALRRHRPDARVMCDPVLGDRGALYLPREMVAPMAEELAARADVLTPNRDELRWLSGEEDLRTGAVALAGARRTVFVTSAFDAPETGILSVADGSLHEARALAEPLHLHGGGDVTAALLMGQLLRGVPSAVAAARAVRALGRLAAAARAAPREDMPVVAQQDDWLAALEGAET